MRVGKRRALYIPSKVARELDIAEGDLLILRVEGGQIVLRPIQRLLVEREKWAETGVEEFEAESEEFSREMEGG